MTKRIWIFLFSLLICLMGENLWAASLTPGAQYSFSGNSVQANGLGMSGMSRLGNIQDMTLNPAVLGDLRRVANSLSIGGFGTTNTLVNLGFAYPTLGGVYSLMLDYISGPSSSLYMNQLLGIRLGISKPITPDLFWGFSLNYASIGGNFTNDWSLGFDMGILKARTKDSFGAGFKNFSYGIALKNIGKLAKLGNDDPFPGMGLSLGASFYPVYLDIYKMRVSSDIKFSWSPLDFQAGIGLEQTLLDIIHLRAGYVYSANGVGPFTLGAGFSGVILVKGSKTDFNVDYSASQQSFNGSAEWLHQVNLNVAWGYYDDKAPELVITASDSDFSPNFDGSKDNAELKLGIKDNTMVKAWEVDILSADGTVIKKFKSVDQLQVRNLNASKVLHQIFSTRKQVEIPQGVFWDGQDELGKRVPDGLYSYKLLAWDENDNKAESQAGQVRIDTVVPQLVVTETNRVFSPNGDGAKETIVYPLTAKNIEPQDQVIAQIRDEKGVVVKTFRFEGQPPASLVWNGKNDREEDVPQGTYAVTIETKDKAGNKSKIDLGKLDLVRDYETLKMDLSAGSFSPNNDGEKDSVTFSPVVSQGRGLESWVLTIMDQSSNVRKTISGDDTVPPAINWDGRDQKGTMLPDGKYLYSLKLQFESGNHPSTPWQIIELDNTPTKVQITPQYLAFSPNHDGKKDRLLFTHAIQGDDDDVITASIKDQAGTVVYYNKSLKKDFPETFDWNGLDKDLNPLPEGTYTYTIDTLDKVGNKNHVEVAQISLKTGLEKVSINADGLALSPNNTNARAKLVFTPQVSSTADITTFRLDIQDSKGVIVKSFVTNKYLDSVEWNGLDDKGYVLPDGEYRYKLSLSYKYGDEPVSVSKPVYIDTKAPQLEIQSSDLAFSPNNDGRKDNIKFKLDVKGDKEDLFTLLVVQDKSGNVVRKFEWKGQVPPEVIWDGKDNQGKLLDEGTYSVELTGEDQAKNTTRKKIASIKMKKQFETLDFSSQASALAPNGDGNLDTLEFDSSISSTEGLEESRLEIKDQKGKVVRVYTMKKDALPKVIWDGKDNNGSVVPDGDYSAVMSYQYDTGNLIQGEISPIILDKTPPATKLTVSPRLFTPDGDGENDTLYINLELDDPNGVGDWSIKIFKLEDGWQDREPLKTWKGSGTVKQLISWDGIGDDKEDGVESVQDYVLQLKANDGLGNILNKSDVIIPVGVLVEKTPDGLRIRVSSVTFDVNKANLTAQTKTVLDKVIIILAKIMSDPAKYNLGKNFRIEVSGHTDDTGDDDYNDKLSNKRALSVYQYLISKDLDPNILTYKGYGEQRPVKAITPEMTKTQKEKFRAKNRRVEFFIRK